MNTKNFIDAIYEELKRARAKFPSQNVWVTLAALGEEVGELNKEVLHFNFEPNKHATEQSIMDEAVQVAVMAIRVALDCEHKTTE